MKSRLGLNATMVANEFIDRYMTVANGEYVKVYLYLLRHQEEDVTVIEIADALNHTEADVRRALAYWSRLGVLMEEHRTAGERSVQEKSREEKTGDIWGQGLKQEDDQKKDIQKKDFQNRAPQSGGVQKLSELAAAREQAWMREGYPISGGAASMEGLMAAENSRYGAEESESGVSEGMRTSKERVRYTPEQVGSLAKESEFTQLLYISQKYMNKVFTPKECEVFAYLYDALHMPVELLEYLVEYCVQGDHYSIRYLETVALNWHEQGINTVDKARQHTASFSKETFSVMKAFGLSDRRPGDSELSAIQKWFKEWGFSKEMVLEACARTLKATHKPSFSYADKILAEWRKAGARTMSDVKKLDAKRESRKQGTQSQASQAAQSQGPQAPTRPSKNQFHNFEQRNTNYDAMVLERLKQRLGES